MITVTVKVTVLDITQFISGLTPVSPVINHVHD